MKEMLAARIDSDLKAALADQASRESRSVSNMLECILRSALTGAGNGVVAENQRSGEASHADNRKVGGGVAGSSEVGASRTKPEVPSPAPVSAPAKGKQRARTSMCEHRIPAGQFCKHCEN